MEASNNQIIISLNQKKPWEDCPPYNLHIQAANYSVATLNFKTQKKNARIESLELTIIMDPYYLIQIFQMVDTLTNYINMMGMKQLKQLRLILKHPLVNNARFSRFARSLNSIEGLKKMDIYSESDEKADSHPNWTDELRCLTNFIKIRTLAEVIAREPISGKLREQMEKTDAEYQYQTELRLGDHMNLLMELEKVSEWYCSILKCSGPNNQDTPNLSFPLHSLNLISFPYLTSLSIISSNIVSIQSLARLNAPVLRKLYFNQNRILTLDTLFKAQFQLQVLQITSNNIQHLNNLTFSGDHKSINQLTLQVDGQNQVQIQNINCLAKIKYDLMTSTMKIQLCSDARITQKAGLMRIKRKYKRFVIQTNFGMILGG